MSLKLILGTLTVGLMAFFTPIAVVMYGDVISLNTDDTAQADKISVHNSESTNDEAPAEKLPEIETIPETQDLLPDLLAFPAEDVQITHSGEKTLLNFSTTYYNGGVGVLELIADPKTAGIEEDIERQVFQRIYQKDGSYRDRPSGLFLWHETHQHFHYSDFVSYVLTSLDNVESEAKRLNSENESGKPLNSQSESGKSTRDEKATFCVRDISRVSGVPNTAPDAVYKVCGRNRQGVAVGWGDTYFFNYPDQNLDITNLASGTYALSFLVNPLNRFQEMTRENNAASVILAIDMEMGAVEVLESIPNEVPDIEHVYPRQTFE